MMNRFRRQFDFETMSIACEFAQARKWAREHPLEVLNKERATVGEMVAPREAHE
jgi:hypothetical protein